MLHLIHLGHASQQSSGHAAMVALCTTSPDAIEDRDMIVQTQPLISALMSTGSHMTSNPQIYLRNVTIYKLQLR